MMYSFFSFSVFLLLILIVFSFSKYPPPAPFPSPIFFSSSKKGPFLNIFCLFLLHFYCCPQKNCPNVFLLPFFLRHKKTLLEILPSFSSSTGNKYFLFSLIFSSFLLSFLSQGYRIRRSHISFYSVS